MIWACGSTCDGWFSAQRDRSSCSGRWDHGRPGWGPQEGRAPPQRVTTRGRALYVPEPSRSNIPEPSEGGPYLATSELSRSGVLAAPRAALCLTRASRCMEASSVQRVAAILCCGTTEPTVRCVMYIHSFPTTTSRTQETLKRENTPRVLAVLPLVNTPSPTQG